jgi:hypothetical protein
MTQDADDYESFLFRAKMMAFAEYSNLEECLKSILENSSDQKYKDCARIALERLY